MRQTVYPKKYIRSSEDYDDYDLYNGKKYWIFGDPSYRGHESFQTDDPIIAIKRWFQFSKKQPYRIDIMAKTKAAAIELVNAATEDYLTSLYEQYGCPYKLEYLIETSAKQVENGCRGYHENPYGFGDSVDPFTHG